MLAHDLPTGTDTYGLSGLTLVNGIPIPVMPYFPISPLLPFRHLHFYDFFFKKAKIEYVSFSNLFSSSDHSLGGILLVMPHHTSFTP